MKSLIQSKKVLIFDFDGTLCASEKYYYLSWAKAFASVGHELDELEYYRTFSNLGCGPKPEIEKYGLNATEEQLREIRKEQFARFVEEGKVLLYPEVSNIITRAKTSGLQVCLASNTPKEIIERILMVSKADIAFEHIVGTTKELKRKPAPDVFLRCLELLQVRKEEVLIFEDSEIGLQAAASAGCEAVWIKNNENRDFKTLAPYKAATTLAELEKALL